MSVLKTLTVNGTTYSVVPVVPTNSVTLLASGWVGSEGSYSQVVALPGVTSHTKVDLQPTPEQVEIFLAKTLAFVTENANGVVTVFSIGDKPTNNYTIQVTMTEVEGASPIRGNTVGLPNPSPDWTQSDSRKADFIRNKPDIAAAVEAALQKAKDSGEFDGAPGEPGPAGSKGDPGEAGPAGKDAISPEILVHPTDGGYTITITDERGTEEFDLLNGKDGRGIDYIDIPDGDNALWIHYTDGNADVVFLPANEGIDPGAGGGGGIAYVQSVNGVKPDEDGNVVITIPDSSQNVDLTGYATEQWVKDQKYLTEHQDISGKLDASALPTAINTALAQAKASGEFKGDKGDKGDTGSAGKDGKSPVRGTDYWTPADKASMIQDVIDALGGVPVFGVVDANNNVVLTGTLADGTYTLKYEDADGNVTEIGTIEVGGATYTNQIPISTDTDGSVYNTTGYKTASRISSSGGISNVSNVNASNPAFVTGFIPCVKGDIIRLANCFIDTDGTGSDSAYYGQDIGGLRVAAYNSSKTHLGAAAWNEYASSGLLANYTVGENGYITEFSINNANCAFIRLCLGGDPANAIVTINEEIMD